MGSLTNPLSFGADFNIARVAVLLAFSLISQGIIHGSRWKRKN